MAKTINKRKSEGDLPIGKTSKHRKVEEHDSSPDAGDSDDKLSVDDKPTPKYVKKVTIKSSRKSEPARLVKNDEYEEDEGRMESQQFLALVEYESRKKKRAAKAASEYMDRFKENIDSSGDALKMRLANLSAQSTDQSSAFLTTFQKVYGMSRPLPPPSSPDEEDTSFVTLFGRSKSLIDNALSLINIFTTANAKTENCEVADLLNNEWEGEVEAAASVLAVGCNVGLEKYQALLQGAGHPIVEEEDEQFVSAIYGAEEKGAFEYGWGKIAKKEEKAAKKFVKFQRA